MPKLFYIDVAKHAAEDAMYAFAGEMAVDPGAGRPGEGDVLPLKP